MTDAQKSPPFAEIALWGALCGFATWESRQLLDAWSHDPSLQGGGLAGLIWTLGAIAALRFPPAIQERSTRGLLYLGGGALIFGLLGHLNALIYLGLTILLLAPARRARLCIFGVIAGISWMPLGAWLFAPVAGSALPPFRWALAGAFFLFSLLDFFRNGSAR